MPPTCYYRDRNIARRTVEAADYPRRGMAKAPTQVQVFGESGRCLIDRGPSGPNHSVVLDMCLDTYCATTGSRMGLLLPP
jgi:hypothetical protein